MPEKMISKLAKAIRKFGSGQQIDELADAKAPPSNTFHRAISEVMSEGIEIDRLLGTFLVGYDAVLSQNDYSCHLNLSIAETGRKLGSRLTTK